MKNDGFVVSHWNMAEEVKPLKKVKPPSVLAGERPWTLEAHVH